MKIELDSAGDSKNKIDAYTTGQVTIAKKVYKSSLLVCADAIVPDWSPQLFSEMTTVHIEQITSLEPEIVIIGTGHSLIFPPESITAPLTQKNIGFEIMDTGAACRSYNFLAGEGRYVVAALLMIKN